MNYLPIYSVCIVSIPEPHVSAPVSVPTNVSVNGKFDNLIKSVFNETIEPDTPSPILPQSVDKELKSDDSNQTWRHVQEFEDSYGLVFKWANSSVYQQLLRTLNVDTSTIVSSQTETAMYI